MTEVRIEGLEKRIGIATILHSLNLTVGDGEFFVLVGPSGCGKSTLLHLLAGLDQPTSGRILFDGRDVTDLDPRERDVALVFQTYALYPHMTVRDNLSFPLRVRKKARRLDHTMIEDEVRRMADVLGINALLDRRPQELSGGQRQRVALGRALIRKPRLFLLDEPLSNLDAQLRAAMRAELRRLHEEFKVTTVYVTHDQSEALTMGDRLGVLHQGGLRQVGCPREVYDRPADVFVAAFVGYPTMNLFDARMEEGMMTAGPLRFPLLPEASTVAPGRTVTVGVRPEDVTVGPVTEEKTGRAVQGIVRLVEPAWPMVWVTVELSDSDKAVTIVGVTIPGYLPKIGEAVVVEMGWETLHLFDPITGRRYERP
ncbi:MAG: ABC transporter ATP-binding protein [Nitrospira sp.]|nr:ABC transporter ATP-binding protein [Nitrospira sp.]MCP9441037.1 ABC transporter ATP-binding protein [Nitrospira sp.]